VRSRARFDAVSLVATDTVAMISSRDVTFERAELTGGARGVVARDGSRVELRSSGNDAERPVVGVAELHDTKLSGPIDPYGAALRLTVDSLALVAGAAMVAACHRAWTRRRHR